MWLNIISTSLAEPDGVARHRGAARLPSEAAGGALQRLRRRRGDRQDGPARQDPGPHGERYIELCETFLQQIIQ